MKLSDRLEKAVRETYLPSQLQLALQEVLAIEVNSQWISTQDGREVEGYTEEEAAMILKKQDERRSKLLKKVTVIKRLIDAKP